MKILKYVLLVFCFFFVGTVFSQDHSDKIKTLSKQLKFKSSMATELKEESLKVLDTLATILKTTDNVYVIESHSSMRGKQEDNLIKTEKRAKIIKAELIKRGIESERLSCKGLGETNRIYLAPTRIGDMKNERINIIRKEQ